MRGQIKKEVYKLSIVNLSGLSVSESSYRRARQIVENKQQQGGKKTADSVLASIRQMKPGWVVDTHSGNWRPGVRNLEISPNVLSRMAEDPEVMVKYKAMILDLEDLVPELEEWAQQNEGKSLEFKITLDANGMSKAVGIVRTLMGGEMRTTFELPNNERATWSDLIRQKLDSLVEGRAEDANGERSWVG